MWQQGGVGPEGAPGRKVKKVFRLEEKSGEEGKKKGGGLFSRKEKKEAVTGRVVLSCCIGEPAALQELEPSSPLSRSIDRDGLGRPARVPVTFLSLSRSGRALTDIGGWQVGGRPSERCMAYCLRCDAYRDANEFFLWNLERGSHCNDQVLVLPPSCHSTRCLLSRQWRWLNVRSTDAFLLPFSGRRAGQEGL